MFFNYLCEGDALARLTAHDPAPGVSKLCKGTTTAGLDAQNSPGAPSDMFVCAKEGEVCSFDGTGEVAFGAGGKFTYKTFTNSALCSSSAFGVDPNNGVVKSCYYRDVTRPQIEDFTSSDQHTKDIDSEGRTLVALWTSNNRWDFLNSDNIPCADFDPSHKCYARTSNWLVCALERSSCIVPKGSVVAYGIPGGLLGPANQGSSKLIYKTMHDGGTVNCNNTTFGGDPVVGPTKTCFYIVEPLRTTPPPGFTYCGRENTSSEKCRIGADRVAQVAFGAYGKFIYLASKVGDFDCTAQVFQNGANPTPYPLKDPNPGVEKGCYYRLY